MLGSVVQRLARNAISAARLSNWSFGGPALTPGGLPVWRSAADGVGSGQRWQHAVHGLATARPAMLGTEQILQQQLTVGNPSTAASIQPSMQQQRLRRSATTSVASDADHKHDSTAAPRSSGAVSDAQALDAH